MIGGGYTLYCAGGAHFFSSAQEFIVDPNTRHVGGAAAVHCPTHYPFAGRPIPTYRGPWANPLYREAVPAAPPGKAQTMRNHRTKDALGAEVNSDFLVWE